MPLLPTNIQFFESQEKFREWLEKNHASEKEVWVGFHKVDTKKPTLTWSQSVDQALCFGWIDGIRKSLDANSYTIRFTPRNPKSVWSNININKVEELTKKGLMHPVGLELFRARKEENSGIYSFEQASTEFTEVYLAKFQENKKAWANFTSMPPSYRKAVIWWVISAKQEETRQKRLEILIGDSERGERISQFKR